MMEGSPLSQFRRSRYYLFRDTSKALRELELPQPLTFRRAVQDTYDWYPEQGIIKANNRYIILDQVYGGYP